MIGRAAVAVVGIGNALVGDDGAGLAVVDRLRERWGEDPRVLLLSLEGDLYGIADHLGRAECFLFADAVAGDEPGVISRYDRAPRAYAPSFHQTDIGTVLKSLERLGTADPFPAWEIWGVSVDPPREVGLGLSPPVAAAVEHLATLLAERIAQGLAAAP